MKDLTQPAYQTDQRWRIVRANEAFCRAFKCAESGIIGRDVRDLLRNDWRVDFRNYVARAMVGVGAFEVTLPMRSPSGAHVWYKHNLEPLLEGGLLAGFRATIQAQAGQAADAPKRWWEPRVAPLRRVWDVETAELAQAS